MSQKFFTEQDIAVTSVILEQTNTAERYTLMTEIRFLLAQNDAKIKYLDVSGFRLLVQYLFGGRKKAKTQLLKNTAAVQKKLLSILTFLDAEIVQLSKEQLCLMEQQQQTFHDLLDAQLLLIDIIDENDLKCSDAIRQRVISSILLAEQKMIQGTASIIGCTDEHTSLMQPESSDRTTIEAGKFRILRIIPRERAVISESGVTITATERDRSKEGYRHLISESEYAQAAALGEFEAVILPFSAPLNGIRARRRLDFNDYQLLLYLQGNHPPIGQQIAMIDYYDRLYHISGYVLTDDGYQTLFQNREFWGMKNAVHTTEAVKHWFTEANIQPNDILYLKSFTVDAYVEKTFARIGVKTFDLNEQSFAYSELIPKKLLSSD